MEKIKLSIIIPHFNSFGLLKKLIQSIPDIPEVEVLIIDDRSENYNEKISLLKQNIKRKNIRFFYNQGVKGAGSCRNIGLKNARGEWLLFADSDDFFVPNWYEIISEYFNLNYDLVYFSPTSINLSTNQISSRHLMYEQLVNNYKQNSTKQNEICLKYQFCTPWSKLIKKNTVIENNIFFDEILVSNDIMFMTKCAYYSSHIKADSRIIYCVTRSGKSLTSSKNEKNFMTRIDVVIRRYKFLEEHLSKKEFNYAHIDRYALGKLVDVVIEKWGPSKFFEILKLYKINHVKFFDLGLLNPITVYNVAMIEFKWWKGIHQERKSSGVK